MSYLLNLNTDCSLLLSEPNELSLASFLGFRQYIPQLIKTVQSNAQSNRKTPEHQQKIVIIITSSSVACSMLIQSNDDLMKSLLNIRYRDCALHLQPSIAFFLHC